MICYIDRTEVPDAEQIAPNVLQYLITKAEQANQRYAKLDRYYRGQHDIFNGKPKQDEVQVAVNYAKYITDITMGYYLGEPVKYDANQRKESGERAVTAAGTGTGEAGLNAEERAIDISAVQNAYDAQQISQIDSDIGKGMGVMGDCLELCYASDDAIPLPRSAYIDPRNGILVCDSTVEHKKLFALIWERRETTAREKYYFLSVYTDRTVKDYRCGNLKNALFTQVGETREHFFGAVPVIAYENNRERQGDFEQIISLMEKWLKERFSLYNHWLNLRGDMDLVGVNDIDIVFTVALPINESEVVQMVTSLQGIVDDQTLLSQLWFIRDPAEAAEAIRRQKEENAQRYGVPAESSELDAEDGADQAQEAGARQRKIGFGS